MRRLVARIPETIGAEDSIAEEPVRVLHVLYSDVVDDHSVPRVGGSVDFRDTTESEFSEEEAGSGSPNEEGGNDCSSERNSSEGGIEIVCEPDVGKMSVPELLKLAADYYYGVYIPESPPALEARGLATSSDGNSICDPPGGVNVTTVSVEIIEEVESITITAAAGDVTDGTNLATLCGKDPIAITHDVPVVNLKLNGMETIALLDTGASFSVVNISFVRSLGVTIRPFSVEAQLANTERGRHDAVLGCNVLGLPKIFLDIANNRIVAPPSVPSLTAQEQMCPTFEVFWNETSPAVVRPWLSSKTTAIPRGHPGRIGCGYVGLGLLLK
ncbi:hypothetical protein BV898_11551 [Hypsibius exemplaris]|nr:hypothetical protein BV898_11551 [Hypsibius exemplaris]